MKIKNRLIISFATIVAFTLIVTISALTGLKAVNNNLKNFTNYSYAADDAIKNCRIQANVAARVVREMVIDTNSAKYPEYKNAVNTSIDAINGYIKILKTSYQGQDTLVAEYEAAVDKWVQVANKIVLEAERNNNVAASNLILTQCSPALNELVTIAQKIDANLIVMEDETLARGNRISNNVSLTVLVCLIVAVIISLTLAIKTTAAIVRPLREVEHAAVEMSKGNLKAPIEYNGTDEVGIVSQALKSSMATLSRYVSDIDIALSTMAQGDFNIAPSEPFIGDFENIERSFNDFSIKMSQTLGQINEASDQVNFGAEQVSSGAQELSQGATEQASAVEELAAVITEVSSQIDANAKNAQTANELSREVGTGMAESNKHMQDMIAAMEDISEKSNEIGKIIKTIDDIAFQTNILALNAAVEAARAGSAGKGFAVVADEVRNLAQKSAEAAKNTTALIEGSITAVANGTTIADETSKALGIVVAKSAKVLSMVGEISEASAQQAEGAQQITLGVDQISSVIQTNSATAQQSAAASEELSSQSAMLKKLVADFKLRRD